jgi:VIT1/CCC1 family predicted Fe2+/Mn2+ transporter
MPETIAKPCRRVLDPVSRISEVLFGLMMALTFTGTLSVTEASREEIRTMLIGAIGCNVAWGLVDAVMYLMAGLTERGRGILALRAVRNATDPAEAHRHIADALPPLIASILQPAELETMRLQLTQLPEPPALPRFKREDYLGAVAVFLLVFLATFPVVTPFIFMNDVALALRISNGIALAMLFGTGYSLGRYTGHPPWRTGILMMAVGGVLVAVTIALGG